MTKTKYSKLQRDVSVTKTKTQNRVKLQTPLRFQHWWQATPIADAPFPYDLMATAVSFSRISDTLPPDAIPNTGADSSKLVNGEQCIITGYSPTKDGGSFEFGDWTFRNITSGESFHPPTGPYFPQQVDGEKRTFKYAHYGMVRPRSRYTDFAVDCLRYDRAFLFNSDDVKVVEAASRREMDPDAVVRIVKYTEGATDATFTPARWPGFGWELVEPTTPFWRE